jgi:hypothetical protein
MDSRLRTIARDFCFEFSTRRFAEVNHVSGNRPQDCWKLVPKATSGNSAMQGHSAVQGCLAMQGIQLNMGFQW